MNLPFQPTEKLRFPKPEWQRPEKPESAKPQICFAGKKPCHLTSLNRNNGQLMGFKFDSSFHKNLCLGEPLLKFDYSRKSNFIHVQIIGRRLLKSLKEEVEFL